MPRLYYTTKHPLARLTEYVERNQPFSTHYVRVLKLLIPRLSEDGDTMDRLLAYFDERDILPVTALEEGGEPFRLDLKVSEADDAILRPFFDQTVHGSHMIHRLILGYLLTDFETPLVMHIHRLEKETAKKYRKQTVSQTQPVIETPHVETEDVVEELPKIKLKSTIAQTKPKTHDTSDKLDQLLKRAEQTERLAEVVSNPLLSDFL